MFLQEAPYALLICGLILVALYLANYFYDAGIPQYISRKIGHFAGCIGFLLCPFLFTSFLWPFILTIGFTGVLLFARWRKPQSFRGVGGSGRPHALAEIHFPATGIVLIGALWGILDQPWLAIVPLCFMGAGDGVTGLVRAHVYKKEVKGNWGSVAMLVTCLLLAYFVRPYYIGVFGSIAAVLAEKFTKTNSFYDDNLTIPLCSAVIMMAFYLIK